LPTSCLGDTGRCDLRVRHRKPGNARTEMTRRPAVQIRPFRIFVIAELVDGEKYAAVSDSEVDCDLGNGMKSRGLTSGDPCCRGSTKYTYSVTPVTWLATGAAFSDSPQATRHYNGLDLVLEARSSSCFSEPTAQIRDENGQCVRGPGEDSTGAGAERELGFDPQPKAELAQGEYKGAREVLARHVHTAEPRGGPGGC
jgi:hypothetical protein